MNVQQGFRDNSAHLSRVYIMRSYYADPEHLVSVDAS